MNVLLRSVSVLSLAAAALAAQAAPYTYTLSTTGTGVLDGVSFTNASVVLTGIGDPATHINGGNANFLQFTSTMVTAGGVSDALSVPIHAIAYDQGAFRILNGQATQGGVVILSVDAAAVTQTALLGPFGPVSGASSTTANASFATLRGSFSLSAVGTTTIVVAPVATPEPATMAALGLGAVAFVKRRKRA